MWELDHEESWVPKNWCFWTVVLEKILENPLEPVNPKGNQSWIFIERIDPEAEAPILWPPDVKWLFREDPDAGKDWRQEENGDDRGLNGWMASPTQWTWVWASSGSWYSTGKPGMLQSIGLQTVRHDWVTELNWWNFRTQALCQISQLPPSTLGPGGKTLSPYLKTLEIFGISLK